jgi:hypothetical protein
MSLERIRRRSEGKALLEKLKGQEHHVLVIHYSCESFYDRTDGSSPRITSIAVRNFGSAQTRSFSIHQVAEIQGAAPSSITASYDDLEREMLDEFFTYVEKHETSTWVHWNMRDMNYGFEAIAHRRRVLGNGGKKSKAPRAFSLPEGKRLDLAKVLGDIHGPGYVADPKLAALVKRNRLTDRDFLSGAEEAAAFVAGEYVKLHQSTLRKVEIIATLLDRSIDGSLKTEVSLMTSLGGFWSLALYFIREHWLFVVLGLVGTLLGILSFVLDVFGGGP